MRIMEVPIVKAGQPVAPDQPVARLVRIEPKQPILGSARRSIDFKPGWDAPLRDKELEDRFGL